MPEMLQRCAVCQGMLDEEDLFCANCGTEAPNRSPAPPPATHTATANFKCQGCAASMSYDASAGTLRCPFCGSEQLEAQADVKVISPELIVPMKLDQSQVEVILRQNLSRGFWRPGDLAMKAALHEVAPVYVPYWVFRASTHSHWSADTNQTPMGARGDWFPLTGEHHQVYEGVLIGASASLTPSETHAISPFDLAEGVPPEQVDLKNCIYEQFSVQRKYARPLAKAALDSLVAETCDAQYVPGRHRNLKVNVLIDGLTSQPVLLPVWIMAYRYQNKLYRFLVNGQTGRATGQAPVSKLKIAGAIGIGAIAVLVLLAALSSCLR